jgi:hypothetical protein
VLTTAFITMPVSAADFSNARPVIGSVSAVGSVYLRGVGISQEGTLFAGDSIRANEKGYAKVLLGSGSKIEVSAKTDLTVSRDAQGVKIAMNTGTIGFTAHSPLRIDVMPFEVTATDDASGNVAVMSPSTAGVRALNGKVTVRNLKTSESFVIMKGQERLLGLQNGVHAPSLAEVASNIPTPIPAPVPAPRPQTPAGKTTGGLAMDAGAWLAVIGGAAIAGVAIWGLVVALNNHDDIDSLKGTIKTLNNTIATQNSAALKNISNAAAIANTAAQQQAQLASVQALAGQAQLALTAAGQPTQAAAAASLASQASANQTQLAALQGQIQAAQAQLAAGTGSATQLQTLLTQEETLRNTTNSLINQLNTLLANNRSFPGVPGTTLGTISGPIVSSASVPV